MIKASETNKPQAFSRMGKNVAIMGNILWLLGVPFTLLVVLWVFGVFR